MKILKTKIKDLVIIKSKFHQDKRGIFKEIFKKNILNNNFVFDCMSKSKKNVVRGLHLQTKNSQAKLITVTQGKIYDVAVDLRKKSKTFGKFLGLIISEKSDFSFFIPEGFAHGFLCLSAQCTVYYKCSNYRNQKSEKTISWEDPDLNIPWPIRKPTLSFKDKKGMSLKEFKDKYL